MITAIAIDDEPPALSIIENFSKRCTDLNLIKTFTNKDEALKFILNYPVDLLFLDIQMPSINGIDFYKSLPQEKMVIFTTAFANYAVEGFNVNAVDYILKPFTFDRFNQAVQRAVEYHKFLTQNTENPARHLYIRADYSLLKVNLNDIILIEGLDDYIKIHQANKSPIVARMTMKAIQEKLPQSEFCRTHRSFIVSIAKVESVKGKTVKIANREIPIGGSYEQSVSSLFS